MKRSLAVAVVPLLVAGCVPLPVTIASTAFSGFSYVASGKSTTDHMLSATLEQDCALTRPVFGDPVCRDVGPNGEGRTQSVTVASYPGDRDDVVAGEPALAEASSQALDLTSFDVTARQVAAAPQFLVAPPRVSIAGIVVSKDQLSPAPGTRVMPASADTSWSSLASAGSEAKAAPTEAVPPAAAGTDGDRWVVLGSFREIDRARVMAARYAGHDPRILDAEVRGERWHRVALGPLAAGEARKVRDDLGPVDGRRPWVIRLDAP